ncbi:BTAD domain-containing putative transcriptional regulator [Polymorphum gilvum]|uniref:Bacterial transcriptional activator domain-containing protein n=1 Tax=Polymorphum gilvum (strain LMG 25793 / CGMCC 1.9160 / SL003B-26A1) TaxID=991905 RepID=F2IXA1_POLGS|nr:BTAD domain-containing putative transcriptional regulator [Polymorphum gilvum]ADZ70419.1 hypothetical protein SL003B_1993 [Polymorphum gilvum SL003B-26A1]
MGDRLYFQTLGQPRLIRADGTPVALKTRKALALLGYLVRRPGQTETRGELGALLWSDADRAKAAVSLRQALRHIRRAEDEIGMRLVEASPTSLSLRPDTMTTDLEALSRGLGDADPATIRAAARLWEGDFLYGFDALDPVFAEWLSVEQDRVRSDLGDWAIRILEDLGSRAGIDQREALARFLLALDPTHEFAHKTLIRLYIDQGLKERALRQYRDCVRELKAHLDIEPSAEIRQLVENDGAGAAVRAPTRASEALMGSAEVDLPSLRRDIVLPVISIANLTYGKDYDYRAHSLRDEVIAGLSAYRCFELYEAAYWGDDETPAPTRVEGGELGSFILRFRKDRMINRIYVQLENRSSGQIAFNEVVDLETIRDADDRAEAVFRTVSRVHSHIIGRLRQRPGRTPFARWCQAEALIWEFNRQADEKAFSILSELEESFSSFSLIYAGKASITLKQLRFYPTAGVEAIDLRGVLAQAEKAVLLDPWQVINHRMFGWLSLQCGHHDDARRAFDQALKLNPLDPMNVMSAAEAMAYLGDVRAARSHAERAFRLLNTVPRILYDYLANIQFAAGDYDQCVTFLERAPIDSMPSLVTRVAALTCTNRPEEAEFALSRLLARFEQQFGSRPQYASGEIQAWLKRVNLFSHPEAHRSFQNAFDVISNTLHGRYP